MSFILLSATLAQAHASEWSEYFRVDRVLNVSWPHAVPHIVMPDTPLIRAAVERINKVPEEHATFMRFLSVFHAVCRGSRGSSVIVDSGANEGFWSLLGAAHGCTALAIEPQPYCARLIRAAGERSGVMDRVQIHTIAYTDGARSPRPCVPFGMCKGTASYSQGKVTDIRDRAFSMNEKEECLSVPLVTLDELVPVGTNVELWHLDVEGAELAALRSARKLIAENRIRRIMIEVDSMMRWRLNIREKITIDKTLAEARAIFADWKCTSVCDDNPYTLPSHFGWGGKAICSNVYCVAPGVHD